MGTIIHGKKVSRYATQFVAITHLKQNWSEFCVPRSRSGGTYVFAEDLVVRQEVGEHVSMLSVIHSGSAVFVEEGVLKTGVHKGSSRSSGNRGVRSGTLECRGH
jgi:hypothetical protein